MLEIKYLNGMRLGKYEYEDYDFMVPNLISIEKKIMRIGKLTLEKPITYQLREHISESKIKSNPLVRITRGAYPEVTEKIQGKNIELPKDNDITPIFLSGNKERDNEFINSLPEAKIFLFDLDNENELLSYYFKIRNKYPNSLIFCNCDHDTLPILAYAGFDLFPDNEKNREALNSFLENPTAEYIEMAACRSISAKTILDLLYIEYWKEIESSIRVPDKKELYISKDSFWRPVARRWMESIGKYYEPKSNIFILLPCSSKKPYSTSKSHKRFINVLKGALGRKYHSVAQLIVTSPYGIVPRELETLIDYDIVVTGNWFYDEIERSRNMLSNIMAKVKDPIVIAHLPDNELEVVSEMPGKIIITSKGHPLSNQSIENLNQILSNIKDLIPETDYFHKEIRMLSEFLYGNDILPTSIKIKGRDTKQIFHNNKCIATFKKTLRPLSENIKIDRKWIEIGFDLKGDLFCVGVLDADEEIRPGDDVVIRKEGNNVAVGTAIISGPLMKKMKKGKAVKIRKRF